MAKVIDAHQHFWDIEKFQYPWMSPDMTTLFRNYLPSDLKPLMDEAGVDQCVFVQANHDLDENRWALQRADEFEFIAGVVGWVDLTAPDVDETLETFAAHPKFVGIRHITHDEPDDDWIVRDGVLRGLESLSKHNMTFDLLVRPQHLKHVPTLVRALPDLSMVIDHIAKPRIADGAGPDVMDHWLADMRIAASFENVSCKLSGMITEANHEHWQASDLKPFVDRVVNLFGFERLMFGSDWPVCNLAGSYGGVVAALNETVGEISDSDRAQLFGGTARRFYGLD